jgi:hypothetical protein
VIAAKSLKVNDILCIYKGRLNFLDSLCRYLPDKVNKTTYFWVQATTVPGLHKEAGLKEADRLKKIDKGDYHDFL